MPQAHALDIARLEAGQFESHRPGLIALLVDAVAHGASVGFLADLSLAEADAYFDAVAGQLEQDTLCLWIATQGDSVLGSVQLAPCTKRNGLNRAEVQKLLVLQSARRQGIARRLMQTLEAEALQRRLGLLYLDTEAGSPAEALYQSLSYQRAGEIPDYAARPDGVYHPTALYFKTLRRPA
ncbi:GNAT family N-acetyltransferase [Stutzerimonas azotifigens]|uniref:GNAT family N-acetyltransferase n=1 Tax=Stutzerimonas azotifigens TaxID=291995 RepID=A0ABR5YZZ2_9GAMM|nr:GNAT family N-acetyltransferase [Stutzerimonas azotifigens]MBA1273460.1 GNAT family N-acetyltransferase [Stutzerimonas azotifigens]